MLLCTCVVIQSSICSELEREKAELTLNSVPVSDVKSRHTVASLLQQLQKQQQINVRLVALCFVSHRHTDVVLNMLRVANSVQLFTENVESLH